MLIVHHLNSSQSERIVWLCEEVGLDYELKIHQRSPLLSPPSYLALHRLGAAPVIQDGDITLAESAACADWIIHKHANGKLALPPSDPHYADYLYWYHFANGTLQAVVGRNMMLKFAGLAEENNIVYSGKAKLHQALEFFDERVKESKWLAGDDFSAADVMNVFTLTTMRQFYPVDLSKYGGILAYLKRVSEREAYQKAMKKGDPDLDVDQLIGGRPPPPFKGLRG